VITGVGNAKKLLEDIPNKVRDILGIIVDVNLKTEMIPNNMSQALMLRLDFLKQMLTFFIRMKSIATFLSRLIRCSICFRCFQPS